MMSMTAIELKTLRQSLRDRLAALEGIKPVCNHCENFSNTVCKLFDEAPPADFQRTEGACESWRFDGVPF